MIQKITIAIVRGLVWLKILKIKGGFFRLYAGGHRTLEGQSTQSPLLFQLCNLSHEAFAQENGKSSSLVPQRAEQARLYSAHNSICHFLFPLLGKSGRSNRGLGLRLAEWLTGFFSAFNLYGNGFCEEHVRRFELTRFEKAGGEVCSLSLLGRLSFAEIRLTRLLRKQLGRIAILSFLLLAYHIPLRAQQANKPIAQLMVGDKLPAAFWKQEHRFLDKGKIVTATLEGFKGKVMLIDFWASWCSSCRTAIPLIDSLSSRFKGDLVVVPVVTASNQDKISQIDQALKDVLGDKYLSSIPTIVEDKYLEKVLPYKYLSTSVLIGRHGRISGFIHHDLLTAETIKQLIDHTQPPRKRNEKVK
jgi:thiol-disulfide isomerase/thioredoxin